MRTGKSLTNFILLALEKSTEGFLQAEDFLYNPHKYLYGYPRNIKKPLLLQSLKRLREKGFIDFIDEQKLCLKLTEEGVNQAMLARIKLDNRKWDNIWRLVIFDIPEKKRSVRDILRFKLKEWGFTKIQKSVWASKKDCASILRKFVSDLGISEWVLVIESSGTGF